MIHAQHLSSNSNTEQEKTKQQLFVAGISCFPCRQSNSLHLPLITSLVPHYLHLVLTPFLPASDHLSSTHPPQHPPLISSPSAQAFREELGIGSMAELLERGAEVFTTCYETSLLWNCDKALETKDFVNKGLLSPKFKGQKLCYGASEGYRVGAKRFSPRMCAARGAALNPARFSTDDESRDFAKTQCRRCVETTLRRYREEFIEYIGSACGGTDTCWAIDCLLTQHPDAALGHPLIFSMGAVSIISGTAISTQAFRENDCPIGATQGDQCLLLRTLETLSPIHNGSIQCQGYHMAGMRDSWLLLLEGITMSSLSLKASSRDRLMQIHAVVKGGG
ncbi:hypothetical protein EYF80_001173 [Liparis tanakae]|uniref:Uncharacterized protein n=1 Tax=Liparis tanakae TaxID=230148 RepID=A0A4Z2JEG1_9TELE|nr:hypothetical protein EYF80_001173 [Liparis tanakae]